ncbi:MAG TPA: hypothetical protein PLZ32_20845 [Saprospiraceae bacterium]|nr:hypothetical protein [Saprospiraceae bacterium]
MKQPLFKRLLSYVSDQLIEHTNSEYNEDLYLLLVKGRYQLVTNKVIYSFEDKYDNFFDAFKKLDLSNTQTCLILGFGIGSIPVMLEKKLNQKISYTGIEIDEEIIYLASEYVLDDLKSPIELIRADAETFIEINEDLYDLICVDLFIDDDIPEQFLQPDFLESCKSTLSDKGILIFNTLYFTNKDRKYSNLFFENTFKKTFPNASANHCGNNLMLFSS